MTERNVTKWRISGTKWRIVRTTDRPSRGHNPPLRSGLNPGLSPREGFMLRLRLRKIASLLEHYSLFSRPEGEGIKKNSFIFFLACILLVS